MVTTTIYHKPAEADKVASILNSEKVASFRYSGRTKIHTWMNKGKDKEIKTALWRIKAQIPGVIFKTSGNKK